MERVRMFIQTENINKEEEILCMHKKNQVEILELKYIG
jgi:hypothetical protein